MGLLDDAIREHLELKRKHGANPEDVARLEAEALGPGQRNEFAQPEPEPEPEPVLEEELPEDEETPAEEAVAEAAATEEDPWLADEEPDEVPAEEALEPPRRPVPEPDGEPSDDDVLDQTPDFLSETPEHDRLWFEQKPPRDFDWDK
ncbi:MAG TPA: hypothetical protein VNS09_00035 [Solirubrobacter sp.]|nr:hypothetical protein [Solirubrobacter sp.]